MIKNRHNVIDFSKGSQRKLSEIRRAGICLNGIEDLITTLESNNDLPSISDLTKMLWNTHDRLSEFFGNQDCEE